MLLSKSLRQSQNISSLIRLSSYNFFSKTSFEPKYDNSVHNELVHDKKYLPFLKSLSSLPLEIGKGFHKEKKSVSIFSESGYLSIMAHKQFKDWETLFRSFYHGLAESTIEKMNSQVEKNLKDRTGKFLRDLSGTGLFLEIIEPQDVVYKVHIAGHNTYKGVFIDRMLNLHFTSYYHKESGKNHTYEVIPPTMANAPKPTQKIDWNSVIDRDLHLDYLEKDRGGYTVNQYVIEVETNAKMILAKKEGGEVKPVYGRLEDGFESHYMVIENKRDYLKHYPFVIVDFDFVLNKNPHVFGNK